MMSHSNSDGRAAIKPPEIQLLAVDGPAFELINPNGKSPILLVCEHASNRIPAELNNLGLTAQEISSHIGWDIGALKLATALCKSLDAKLLAARYSRLVYDCNRPPEAESAMPSSTEVCSVPGNQKISDHDRRVRTQEIYEPFHLELSNLLSKIRSKTNEPILVTIHSFTPEFNGKKRDVEIGYLHGDDSCFADQMYRYTGENKQIDVRLNQPYAPKDGVLHTIDKHLADQKFPYVMIEIRNDLLATENGVKRIHDTLLSALMSSMKTFRKHSKNFNYGFA